MFTGIQFAGELIDLQIGFAVANVINPTTQQQVTIIGEFELALATLLFLVTDSHVCCCRASRARSIWRPCRSSISIPVAGNVVIFLSQAFLIVFKIAAPVGTALFLTNVGLALMARVAPQMNVFVVGFPCKSASA